MKVTTELKNVIKRSFAERKEALRKAFLEEAKTTYNEKIKWLSELPEFQEYIAASKKLEEKLKDIPGSRSPIPPNTYYYRKQYFCEVEPENIIVSESPYYICEHNPELNKQIDKLSNEQDALLVKLTYEKDIKKIEKLLEEYQITL